MSHTMALTVVSPAYHHRSWVSISAQSLCDF